MTPQPFTDPNICANGSPRAIVPFEKMKMLWINTGTLCNITCANCYIESSPRNDRLLYITADEVTECLRQLHKKDDAPKAIGITGGEPFMNKDIFRIILTCLDHTQDILLLTNAMRPLLRPHIQLELLNHAHKIRNHVIFRVSLDDSQPGCHDAERGTGAFALACEGIDWLIQHGFTVHIAGRLWGRAEQDVRASYARLFHEKGWTINASKADQLILFPEMTSDQSPPEITTDCWRILNKSPSELMCATGRMLVRRKNQTKPSLVACTLLPYEDDFDLGTDMSNYQRDIALNHPWCASFCVLGGGACSAT